ncbi:hypothetical protein [Planococcus sp. ISL-110]|uniref:hypothetical protein n=1 Tax=Planococcus sp. ISL-110 TaxID=2819167 RepID=UPI001BE5CC3E|nr:hypothetical protein [Planococcus sp. ISL-110]MBT2571784.1 hypothetical protein [Planococcus sp. ISL-110]
MFGFLKLSGAPPRAYAYYKQSENIEEKKFMEDLYNKFSSLIKKYEIIVKNEAKLEPPNRNESIREFRKRQEAKILIRAYDDMVRYGLEKGYPEFLISLFYPKEVSPYMNLK